MNVYDLLHKELKRLDIKEESISSQNIFEKTIEKWNLSTRAYIKILKLSRTIADLEGKKDINENHILEAIQYRKLERR